MNKLKKILIFLLIVIIMFLIFLTIYRFNKEKTNIKKENDFYIFTLSNEEKENKKNTDKELYKENILNINKINDYKVLINSVLLEGKIYITNNYLYMTNGNKNYKLSDISFKDMLVVNEDTSLVIYLISTSNNIYISNIIDYDLNKIKINKINTEYEIESFTNLSISNYGLLGNDRIVCLFSDGNMYSFDGRIRYSKDLIFLDNTYYINKDNTIFNSNGIKLKYNNKLLKIKYYIELFDNKLFNTSSLIITDDNRIIYVKENTNDLYVYDKIINRLDYTLNNNKVKLNILFEDNTNTTIIGLFTKYYGFGE